MQGLKTEMVSILEAVGRVSAEDLYADCDLPPRQQSAVDGYAVAAENPMEKGKYYIAGHLSLGDIHLVSLEPGQAMGVKTGGDLPPESRAVVPRERVDVKDNYLRPLEAIKDGNNIKQAGEDYVRGNLLLSRGSVVTAGDVALLAAYGRSNISVYRKPRIAVLCLSKNVVSWRTQPEPGQTRDSNGPLLSALILKNGGLTVAIKNINNGDTSISTAAEELIEQADILILIGGTYSDNTNEARLLMENLGAEFIYWGVPIQPGSHTGASLLKSRLLFSLSGNPAACAVGYQLFVNPVLLAMQGLTPFRKRMQAICINSYAKKSVSRRFVRGYASCNNGDWQVTVLPGQKPSMIRSLVNCNALIDMPPGSPPIEVGQEVSIILLRE
ncbi:MAG: molybdopterin molybdotransferase MoeA [Syntrophomonas sp.]|nr:molybdopterin molybdotransferase MoeA [Syntrophomonas sp.]